nr:transcription antitermination factor NusB [Natronosporangium hydrolyticum]
MSRHQQRPATSTPQIRRSEDPPRRVAYEAIAAVHRDDAYANLVLPTMLTEVGLAGRDAAFATELVYGTLRQRGTLDAVLASAANREVARIDPPARDALRLGAYQLLFLRVPAHAAVSSTVGLVKSVAPGATGFANAVLRQVATKGFEEWLVELAPAQADDPVGHLALVHSHPAWVVRAFADALGGDLTEVAQALAEDNAPAPVHLCARPGRADAVDLADEVGGEPGAFSPYAVYLSGGAPGNLPAIGQRRAHVQDEGSQLVTLALADAPVAEGPAQRWLDLCAGPGGKAALLGGLAAERGATVTAVEIAEHRARLVEQAVRGLPVAVVNEDGRAVGRGAELPAGQFDRVLVDAPCTGLGALRRRPEVRWRRSPGDLPELARLQRELLVAAIEAARPGGVVGYVTCSPHLVETQVSLSEARRRSPHRTELLDAREYLPAGMPGLGDGPTVQLWPHRHGTDAMFVALLRRG